MPHLTIEDWARLIGQFQAGIKVSEAARSFVISHQACHKLINKFNATGTVKSLKAQGRPRATSGEEDATFVALYESDRFLTPTQSAQRPDVIVSRSTFRRRLLEHGLKHKPII